MESLFNILLQYGYIVLFIGLLIDALGIPFPGDLLLLASGYLVSQGSMSLSLTILTAIVAVVMGDSLTFGIGKAVCKSNGTFVYKLYCKWTKCTFSSKDCFQRACNIFQSFGKKSVLFSKFMLGMREFIPPLAGLSGMQYAKFISLDATGVLLWVSSLILAGKLLGPQAEILFSSFQNLFLNLALLFAVIYGILLSLKTLKRKRHGKVELSPEATETILNGSQHLN